mgnify:CR=1 FL=1
MIHNTFISYKYSEARDLRDRIIDSLGSEYAKYYRGEDGFTDDMSSLKAETIKKKLSDMMYDTSVTIVILSPNMKESKWIGWEVEYCLKHETRQNRTSHTNGLVGVIMKVNGNYNWLKNEMSNCHGTTVVGYNTSKLLEIINKNHFNSNPAIWHCDKCKTYDSEYGSYIEYVEEDRFLENPIIYIDRAYEKSENDGYGYDVHLTNE